MNARHIARVAGAALLSLVFAACGGGSGGSTTPVPVTVASVAPGGATSSSKTHASLVIHLPSAATTAAAQRSAQYISASTQSIAVAIAPQTNCTTCSQGLTVNTNLIPSGSNCQSGGGNTTCTLGLDLNPGTYTFAVTTYSGPLAAGVPTGSALSVDTGLAATIVSGQDNPIGVTLNGIPAGIRFTIVTADPLRTVIGSTLFAGQQGAIFAVDANAIDAGGNLITGMGTTTVTTTLTPGTPSAGYAVNAVPNSNVIGVVASNTPSLNTDTVYVTLHSTNCQLAGAVCTGTLTVRMSQVIAVVDAENGTAVDTYTPWGGHVGHITQGLSGPSGLAFTPEGTLLVANSTNNTVTAYDPPYSAAPFATTTGVNGAFKIVSSRDGEVFVSASANVYEITSPYNSITATLTGFTGALYMATDRSDNLFVSDGIANTVQRFNLPYVPQGAQLAYSTTPPHTASALAVTTGNLLFLGNRSNGTINELNAAGTVLPTTLSTTGGVTDAMTLDRSDNLAILTTGSSNVSYFAAPSYAAPALLPLPSGGIERDIVFDQFGNLYASYGGAALATYTAPAMTAGTPLVLAGNQTDSLAIWTPDP